MLPDRSKRIAGLDEDIPRLTLASNGQLMLVALMVAILLVVIFPRKALVEQLYDQETLDELTLSYIQNLYRADARNADLALLLARSQLAELSLKELEDFLTPLATSGDERQKLQARTMLLDRYEERLDEKIGATERASILASVKELLTMASKENLSKAFAGQLASIAFAWDLPQLGLIFLAKGEGGRSAKVLERYAEVALADRNYAKASEYFLLAREEAKDFNEARRLFILGIDTLMEGGLYAAVANSVRNHLGNLEQDQATLRFIVRTALAADNLDMAAEFARKLVFKDATLKAAP